MRISARNQLLGQVIKVQEGAVNGIVTLEFAGETITGTISMASINELELVPGKKAVAIVKATEVMIGIGDMTLSARNKITGIVSNINEGAVNAIVTLDIAGGKGLLKELCNINSINSPYNFLLYIVNYYKLNLNLDL